MRCPGNRRVITRDRYDAVLLDRDGAMAYPDEARAGRRRVIGCEVASPAMNELPP
jgi:hypothetical protein